MKRYVFPTIQLPKAELSKVYSEINTNYTKYKDKRFAIHMSYGIDGISYWYYFENYGYNEYNIYARVKN